MERIAPRHAFLDPERFPIPLLAGAESTACILDKRRKLSARHSRTRNPYPRASRCHRDVIEVARSLLHPSWVADHFVSHWWNVYGIQKYHLPIGATHFIMDV